MSVENLIKELDIIHEQVRSEPSVKKRLELMTERDKIMSQLSQARKDEAAYYQQKIKELEENSRPKTFQSPFKI
jgi:cytochrome c556